MVYDVGYNSKGYYKVKVKGKATTAYITWRNMLQRCYDSKYHIDSPTYIGCTVCSEWLDFQVFAKWYSDNYYKLPNEKTHLDKDMLIRGNKIYSPETCLFIPQSINSLLTLCNARRGNLPLGVNYDRKKYKASCSIEGKQITLGAFNTPEQASEVYQTFKRKVIYTTIERYDNIIPANVSVKLYSSLEEDEDKNDQC